MLFIVLFVSTTLLLVTSCFVFSSFFVICTLSLFPLLVTSVHIFHTFTSYQTIFQAQGINTKSHQFHISIYSLISSLMSAFPQSVSTESKTSLHKSGSSDHLGLEIHLHRGDSAPCPSDDEGTDEECCSVNRSTRYHMNPYGLYNMHYTDLNIMMEEKKPRSSMKKLELNSDEWNDSPIESPNHASTNPSNLYYSLSSLSPSLYTSSLPSASSSPTFIKTWLIPAANVQTSSPFTVILCVASTQSSRQHFLPYLPTFYNAGYAVIVMEAKERLLEQDNRSYLNQFPKSSSISNAQANLSHHAPTTPTSYQSRSALTVLRVACYAKTVLGYHKVIVIGSGQGAVDSIIAAAHSPSRTGNKNSTVTREREIKRGPATSMSSGNIYSLTTNRGEISPSKIIPPPTPFFNDIPPVSLSASYFPWIDGVVAENPYCTRERYMMDSIDKALGWVPKCFPFVSQMLMNIKSIYARMLLFLLEWSTGGIGVSTNNKINPGVKSFSLDESKIQYFIRLITSPYRFMSSFVAFLFHEYRSTRSTSIKSHPLYHHHPYHHHTFYASSLTSSSSTSHPRHMSPLDLISLLSPRPVLLIHTPLPIHTTTKSSEMSNVSINHVMKLYERARDPKKVWVAHKPTTYSKINKVEQENNNNNPDDIEYDSELDNDNNGDSSDMIGLSIPGLYGEGWERAILSFLHHHQL